MHCLICDTIYTPMVSWQHFLTLKNQDVICENCRDRLEIIQGEICDACGRSFSKIDAQYRHKNLCYDCMRWKETASFGGVLTQNRSVYAYDEFLKSVMSTFKFRGDYVLIEVFRQLFSEIFLKYYTKESIIIPIPLSEERLYERGFNQAEALSSLLPFPSYNLLSCYHHEKQSKKSRQERLHAENIFYITDASGIQNKSVILIDDIYTTGMTLHHAAKLLREKGARNVCSFTLARS